MLRLSLLLMHKQIRVIEEIEALCMCVGYTDEKLLGYLNFSFPVCVLVQVCNSLQNCANVCVSIYLHLCAACKIVINCIACGYGTFMFCWVALDQYTACFLNPVVGMSSQLCF